MSDIPAINEDLYGNSHEEADTLMIMHAIDVGEMNPFRELVMSPGTDVLLLLIHYYQQLPTSTIFNNGRDVVDIGRAFESLGTQLSQAILGFHAFTGCDQTSKFNGISKRSCWKVFVKSDETVIKAFQKIGQDDFDDSLIPAFEK